MIIKPLHFFIILVSAVFLYFSESNAAIFPTADINGYLSVGDEPIINSADTCRTVSLSGSPNLNFGSDETITRSSGTWFNDGYRVNEKITISGTTSNNGTYRIRYLDGDVLGIWRWDSLTNENNVSGATVTVTRTCHTLPSTCDQIVTTGDPNWAKITGNQSEDVFCIRKGDHSGKGELILDFGSSQKWIVYEDAGTIGDSLHPVDQSVSDRAIVARIEISSGNWVVHKLTIEGDKDQDKGFAINVGEFPTNPPYNATAIIDNCFIDTWGEGKGNNLSQVAIWLQDGNTKIIFQNNVVGDSPLFWDYDTAALEAEMNDDTIFAISNNEFYNNSKHIFLSGTSGHDMADKYLPIENNDLYDDTSMNITCTSSGWGYSVGDRIDKSHPNFNVNGSCRCGEVPTSNKAAGRTTGGSGTKCDTIVHYVHNRIFDTKAMWNANTGSYHNCGGTGDRYGPAWTISKSNECMFIERNIIWNVNRGVSGVNNETPAKRNNFEIASNIFYDNGYDGTLSNYNADQLGRFTTTAKGGIYYNTVIQPSGNDRNALSSVWNADDTDGSCNLIVTQTTANWSGGSVGNNAYVDGATSWGGTGNQTYSLAAADLEQYCFFHKLITGSIQKCLDSAIPAATSPLVAGCSATPSSGYGIGVN